MATYKQAPVDQNQAEIRKWIVDFTDDLPSAVTVATATATHTPPSGSAQSPTVAVATPLVTVTFTTPTVAGVHYLLVTATLSNAEKASVTIAVPVEPSFTQPRAGMVNLITRLRSMTEAGAVDYNIAGVTHWTDVQLQGILDGHRSQLARSALNPEYEYVAEGSAVYKDYFTEHRNFEEAAGGAAVWDVEDGQGESVGTASYTVNYEAGHIRFTTDTEGTAYYLTARTFDMKRAAAEVWERKASHAAKGYFFTADGASYHREQVYEHCLKMAEQYRENAGVRVVRMFRSDVG